MWLTAKQTSDIATSRSSPVFPLTAELEFARKSAALQRGELGDGRTCVAHQPVLENAGTLLGVGEVLLAIGVH